MARKKSDLILAPCSIRITPEIKQEIERQAAANSRSFNSQILLILTKAVRVPGSHKPGNTTSNGQNPLPLYRN